ncbi:Ff.00g061670.m01.CDS01 [Fusarium sp. VM40]|nr:Ff.00g061670.m01.CDS01 [Fusarium sp. VM40]
MSQYYPHRGGTGAAGGGGGGDQDRGQMPGSSRGRGRSRSRRRGGRRGQGNAAEVESFFAGFEDELEPVNRYGDSRQGDQRASLSNYQQPLPQHREDNFAAYYGDLAQDWRQPPPQQMPRYGYHDYQHPPGQMPGYGYPGGQNPPEQMPGYGYPGGQRPMEQYPRYGDRGNPPPPGQIPGYGYPGSQPPPLTPGQLYGRNQPPPLIPEPYPRYGDRGYSYQDPPVRVPQAQNRPHMPPVRVPQAQNRPPIRAPSPDFTPKSSDLAENKQGCLDPLLEFLNNAGGQSKNSNSRKRKRKQAPQSSRSTTTLAGANNGTQEVKPENESSDDGLGRQKKLRSGNPGGVNAETHVCGNCKGKAHVVATCNKPRSDGLIHGCAICNAGSHPTWTCGEFPRGDDKKLDQLRELVFKRANRPALHGKFWYPLMHSYMQAHPDTEVPGLPWTKEFSQRYHKDSRLQNILRYDMDNNELFTVDPNTRTWQAAVARYGDPGQRDIK